jgi:hypothetical protein
VPDVRSLAEERHRLESILWSSAKQASAITDCWATQEVDCSGCDKEHSKAKKGQADQKSKGKTKAKETKVETKQYKEVFKPGRSTVMVTLSPIDKIGIPTLLVLGTHGVTSS